MLGYLATYLFFKVGVRIPRALGLLPGRFYVGEAIRRLRRDDLDGAFVCYRTARGKSAEAEVVKVLHELLTMELRHRRQALEKRRETLQRTLTASGAEPAGVGMQLTTTFCQSELRAADEAERILVAFAAELSGDAKSVVGG